MDVGRVRVVAIEEEMRTSYLDYAMSVIVARALPDVRDGLKPVHRRILYAMHELGLRSNGPFRKSAAVVGEVLGKYHPHGDAPVYDAMVRMAQGFNMRYALVDGQGNFGSVDGDRPAAMRYTEARLTALAEEMLADIDKNTVAFAPTYDDSRTEPAVLPAKVPNLLVNGSTGIAVGMATNIPPHNLAEVCDALCFIIDRFATCVERGAPFDLVWARAFGLQADPQTLAAAAQKLPAALRQELVTSASGGARRVGAAALAQALVQWLDDQVDVTPEELGRFVKGPDFPTAGIIVGVDGLKNAHATGHGRIVIRARAHIEEPRAGRFQLIVTELPYQVNKATLIEKIADLVRDKRVEGIAELRDESDREGMRIVVEVKRDAQPRKLLNQLYKHTAMQTAFSVNMLALVDGQPRVLTLKTALLHYVNFRREVVTRRTQFDLDKARQRAHVLEGLKTALDHLDAVIQTIRQARDVEAARQALMRQFKLTEVQAQAILDMQLRRLASLERRKILDELKEVREVVVKLEDLLAHPVKILGVVREELQGLKQRFGDARRTRILPQEAQEFTDEDLIPDVDVVVTVSGRGYVKRLPASTYRVQHRGGRGVTGMVMREDDAVRHVLVANTHDSILFFTDRGRVFQTKAHELPDASRQARGLPLTNVIGIESGETVTAAMAVRRFVAGQHFVLATRRGEVKRVAVSEFASVRPSGLIAMSLEADDELRWVRLTHPDQRVIMLTRQGQALCFACSGVRVSARASGGIRGMRLALAAGDAVAGFDVVRPGGDMLIITARGYGKRTPLEQFPVHLRGGGGVRALPISDRVGPVAAARSVLLDDEVVLVSAEGLVIRTSVAGISRRRRAAGCVQVMGINGSDTVVALARLSGSTDRQASGVPDETAGSEEETT